MYEGFRRTFSIALCTEGASARNYRGDSPLGVQRSRRGEVKDQTDGDFPVVWQPGTYTYELAVCQGECGHGGAGGLRSS